MPSLEVSVYPIRYRYNRTTILCRYQAFHTVKRNFQAVNYLLGFHLHALKGDDNVRKLMKYKPTAFLASGSQYNNAAAGYAVSFIEALSHTKGAWAGKPSKGTS